uniref:50S ribosomal protein L34 n=1 Tax=Laurencia australis TaxID=3073067 RepID=A0AA51NE13_9FLOR|nr:50S ribosomal protein L34 [Laurencia australis]WMP11942.1 50S ribosomal protein L34 [Laurencia australis]
MNKGTKLKKSRKIGFLVKMSTKSGRRIINNRRRKKRKKIIS